MKAGEQNRCQCHRHHADGQASQPWYLTSKPSFGRFEPALQKQPEQKLLGYGGNNDGRRDP